MLISENHLLKKSAEQLSAVASGGVGAPGSGVGGSAWSSLLLGGTKGPSPAQIANLLQKYKLLKKEVCCSRELKMHAILIYLLGLDRFTDDCEN